MKIVKHGCVSIEPHRVSISGWIVEPEPSDPRGAAAEQLLAEIAAKWAMNQLLIEILKAQKARDESNEKLRKAGERAVCALRRQVESKSTEPADGEDKPESLVGS